MKILVLNPPFKSQYGRFSRSSRSPAITTGGTLYYPIWLAWASGVLEGAGHQVKLTDAPAQRLDIKQVIQKLTNFQPRLIVVDTSTASIMSDIKVAATLKKHYPKSFIVLVGTHVSALPRETLKLSRAVDAIAVGEYDYTLRDLAQAIEANKSLSSVLGIVWHQGKRIIHNKPRPLIDNLDKLPFVSQVYSRHLNFKDYFFAASDWPVLQLWSGRGCPNRCIFCVYPQVMFGRRYRSRSPENLAEEFQWIKDNLPEIREIGIEDDTFTIDTQRVRRFCQLLINRKIKIKWYCNVRVTLDFETLRLMKKAGCQLVTVGFESSHQEVLDQMHKGIKVGWIRQFVSNCRKAGLLVHGCFMAGNPGDTRKTIDNNLKMALELNCDSMQFYPLIPYPGTEYYDWVKINGYLKTTDFSQWCDRYGRHNCVIDLPNLKAEELVRICQEQTKRYYLRPKYLIFKLLRIISSPTEIRRYYRAGRSFLSTLRGTSKSK